MKNLYIFTTTDNQDIYINTIIAFRNENVRNILLVTITEDKKKEEENIEILTDITERIHGQLRSLSSGNYTEYKTVYTNNEKGEKKKEVLISKRELSINHNIEWYQKFREKLATNGCSISTQNISVDDLSSFFKKIGKDNKIASVFDVSGLKKHLLVKVIIELQNNSKGEACVFELKKRPHYQVDGEVAENDLIHALPESKYKLRYLDVKHKISGNFVKNNIFKIISIVALIIAFAFFFITQNSISKKVFLYDNAEISIYFDKSIQENKEDKMFLQVKNVGNKTIDSLYVKIYSDDIRFINKEKKNTWDFKDISIDETSNEEINYIAENSNSKEIKIKLSINDKEIYDFVVKRANIDLVLVEKFKNYFLLVLAFFTAIFSFWDKIKNMNA